jgi:hypothetical protein
MIGEYPPQNPGTETLVPIPPKQNVATTGADIVMLALIGIMFVFYGVWAIVYVGKQSDRHHKDDE